MQNNKIFSSMEINNKMCLIYSICLSNKKNSIYIGEVKLIIDFDEYDNQIKGGY